MRATARMAIVVAAAALAGCVVVPADGPMPLPPASAPVPVPVVAPSPDRIADPATAARSFVTVIDRMEPAIERDCLARRTRPINCDYQFVVDDRRGLPINAFQTVDRSGRPIIGFTLSLIAAARNADEIAFVVGHEASHHVLNHLAQKSSAATAGALILGGLATVYSGSPSAVETAREIGASVGSRYYSKEWELQADYLGAIMTLNAGYDPRRGAAFFQRIPDPGDRILGTHPSRTERLTAVERAVADLRAGRVR